MIQFEKLRKIQYYINQNKEYHLFNFLIFIFVLFVFIYLKTDLSIIKCPYSKIGIQCNTCGLTTSLKQIITGNYLNVNKGHFLFFLLIVSQLAIRPLASFIVLLFSKKTKVIVTIDATITLILTSLTYNELLF